METWRPEEVEALASLAPRFREGGGSISWIQMEHWLRENEEKKTTDANNWEPCALRSVHFEKGKLRSRWKNDTKKLKQMSAF
jgi:hypothetical protein